MHHVTGDGGLVGSLGGALTVVTRHLQHHKRKIVSDMPAMAPAKAPDFDHQLSESGFVVIGKIDHSLIEQAKDSLDPLQVLRKRGRQTELKWMAECNAICQDFETVRKK